MRSADSDEEDELEDYLDWYNYAGVYDRMFTEYIDCICHWLDTCDVFAWSIWLLYVVALVRVVRKM